MLRVTDLQYWMHPTLKTNLDTLVYNLEKDWQFIIIISGDSKVRIGKSMLAQQTGYYCAYMLNRPFSVDNIFFSGQDMRVKASDMPPSVIILDESRRDLSSTKTLREETQNLIDFFNETGVLNHLIIVVIPDYFDLTKNIATGHSKYLINCFVKGEIKQNERGEPVEEYKRGYFEFFGENRKKLLYLRGKKEHDYKAVNYNFWGEFRKRWIVDEGEYERRKRAFIKSENTVRLSRRDALYKAQRDALLTILHMDLHYKQSDIIKMLENHNIPMIKQQLSRILTTVNSKQINI